MLSRVIRKRDLQGRLRVTLSEKDNWEAHSKDLLNE